MIYVFDLDGIEHNNPSLDLYQKTYGTLHSLDRWMRPRRLDDVHGYDHGRATNITLREELWPEMDLPGVIRNNR